MRHGLSEGNVNGEIYHRIPDYTVRLTEKGRLQAFQAGLKIREAIHNECGENSAGFYISPFWRARDTFNEIARNVRPAFVYQEVRIREQEWGQNLIAAHQEVPEKERDSKRHAMESYSRFYYRHADGESGADVYDRVSGFLTTLHREFNKEDYPQNIVVVTHGLTLRVLLMRWFHLTVEEYESITKIQNGCVIPLVLDPNTNKYIKPLLSTKVREGARVYEPLAPVDVK